MAHQALDDTIGHYMHPGSSPGRFPMSWIYKRFADARPDYRSYLAVCDKHCPFLSRGQKLNKKEVDLCCFDTSTRWFLARGEIENQICFGWARVLIQEIYNLYQERKQTREFLLQNFLKSAMEELNEVAPEDLQLDNEMPKA